jgi:hypothetical protein
MLIVAFKPWSNLASRNLQAALLHRVLPIVATALLGGIVRRFIETTNELLVSIVAVAISILILLGLWQLKFPEPLPGRRIIPN